jgi:hypothetical protein
MNIADKPEQEIGRELKASELKPDMIVIIAPPGNSNVMVTMWVSEVDAKVVDFYAGEMRWHVLNFIQPDGSITDDQGRLVRVYEYLGQP